MEPIEHTTQQLHFPTSEPPTQDHAAPPTVALTVPVPSAPPAPPPQPPAARPTATRGRTTISDDVVGRVIQKIVDLAVASLRVEYAATPDPRGLLDAPFTLRDLQDLHEAVAGEALPRDAFRRSMEDRIVRTGQSRRGVVGKPARLFTHGVPS